MDSVCDKLLVSSLIRAEDRAIQCQNIYIRSYSSKINLPCVWPLRENICAHCTIVIKQFTTERVNVKMRSTRYSLAVINHICFFKRAT